MSDETRFARQGGKRVNRTCVDQTCMGRAGAGWSVSGIRLADKKGFGRRSPLSSSATKPTDPDPPRHASARAQSAGRACWTAGPTLSPKLLLCYPYQSPAPQRA